MADKNTKKELDLDSLDNISGGAVKQEGKRYNVTNDSDGSLAASYKNSRDAMDANIDLNKTTQIITKKR